MLLPNEIVVDNFAGGGGASTGMELGLNRHVDIAINHDKDAIDMHRMNHPETKHYCEDVWHVDPVEACEGRPVGLAWFSPDCKHFSKAKGSRPVDRNIRGLAWVAVRWASLVPVRVFMLENVEEFLTWGPVKEISPDVYKPDPERLGETYHGFIQALTTGIPVSSPVWKDIYSGLFQFNYDIKYKLQLFKAIKHGLGYTVEHKILSACDFGAPTIRKRLFLVARNDGKAINWPEATHGKEGSGLTPYRTAADIIDWSIPVKSIFGRSRPLAEKTLQRICKGLQKFVIECENPFIAPDDVQIPFITEHANATNQRNMSVDEPVRTICASVKGGHFALVSPYIVKCNHGGDGQFRGQDVEHPLQTLTGKNGTALVSAFIAKHYTGVTGSDIQEPLHTVTTADHNSLVSVKVAPHIDRQFGNSEGASAEEPLGTVTAGGAGKSALVTSHMVKLRGNNIGHGTNEPLHTVSAGGFHLGEVRAFLIKYYGTNYGHSLDQPLQTVTTKHRFGLVTIHGEEYQIVDIGMRMLEPHELFAAQGFPEEYQISHKSDGKKRTKADQVARCGNSVCPPVSQALVEANVGVNIPQEVAA